MTAAPVITAIDKAALFETLRYEPHEGQWLVHNSTARFRVIASGARWGKSTGAAMEVCAALLAPAPSTLGWIVAPTVELTRFVMDRVRIALIEHMPHRVIEDDQRAQRLVVRNLAGGMSELRAKTADSPAGLLGQAVDFLVVDEAAKLKDDVWESYLSPRLIDRKGWALLISTPRGAEGWFYQAWKRGQKGRDPEFESWRASTISNPHISREIVEAERARMSKESFAQEMEAQFIGDDMDPCDACGNPSATIVRDIRFADLATEPRCAVCNGIVDGKGRTRVHPDDRRGPCLYTDGGAGLRAELQPGEDLATAIVTLRFRLESGNREPTMDDAFASEVARVRGVLERAGDLKAGGQRDLAVRESHGDPERQHDNGDLPGPPFSSSTERDVDVVHH